MSKNKTDRKALDFELEKTCKITGLSKNQVKKFLFNYTNSEIRMGKVVKGIFVPANFSDIRDYKIKNNINGLIFDKNENKITQ